MTEITWVSAVVGFATLVQSCTGFGFALISVPFLSLFLDLKIVVPIAVFYAFLLSAPLSFMMRKDINKKAVLYLTLGSLPGIFVGIEFLKNAKPEFLLVFMGCILFLYCTYELLKKKETFISFNFFWTMIFGLFSGILGSSVGESGPPIVVYTSCQNWTNDQIKSTMLCFFSIQMAGVILMYFADGMYQEKIGQLIITSMPAFLVGGAIGLLSYRLIKSSHLIYHQVIHLVLLVNGAYIFISNLMRIT
ncbi:MAG: sulfite exporter TauE/SafE family protein [Oligoflexales bacterium]